MFRLYALPIQREVGFSDLQRFKLAMSFVNFFARKPWTCIFFRMPCTIATISSTVRSGRVNWPIR